MALLPPMLPGLVAIENLKELRIMGEHVNNVQAEMLIKAGYGEPVMRSGKGGAKPKKDTGLSKASDGYGWLKSRPNVEVAKSRPEGEDTDLTSRRRSKGLEKLWLKSPSPSIMFKLEKWVEGNKETLKSLSVVVCLAPTVPPMKRHFFTFLTCLHRCRRNHQRYRLDSSVN
jgi:hypothetical protein